MGALADEHGMGALADELANVGMLVHSDTSAPHKKE